MAILATSRRWELTRVWAALWSALSRHARARRSSASWASIGYLRISCIYRVRLASGAMVETLEAIGWKLLGLSVARPDGSGARGGKFAYRYDYRRRPVSLA